jgi:hypothetical protein
LPDGRRRKGHRSCRRIKAKTHLCVFWDNKQHLIDGFTIDMADITNQPMGLFSGWHVNPSAGTTSGN